MSTNSPKKPKWPDKKLYSLEDAAGAVIAIYASAFKAERDAGPHIAGRLIRGRAVSPFRAPENILKRYIYRLAYELSIAERVDELREYVTRRDKKIYRPRLNSAVDWTLRLINRRPRSDKLARELGLYANPDKHILLGDSRSTRIAAELNLAFDYKIIWQLSDMFISHLGGYKIISAHNVIFDQELTISDLRWLNYISWDKSVG